MTEEPSKPPANLQPLLKASATLSSSNLAALSSKAGQASRIPPPLSAPDPNRQFSDATCDEPTASFIRQTLCAHQLQALSDNGQPTLPIEKLLPPLTSSNEVDLQLYALIAILIKEFVTPWYARITSDHGFVEEVVQIIAHATREVEQRLRKVDLEMLVMDEIPALVNAHVIAYRMSHKAAYDQTSTADVHLIYHTLRSHPALSPVPDKQNSTALLEQHQNDSDYRQLLSEGLLAVLLPTDDLQNPCLRALVSEVFADLILGNFIGGRLCESVFIWGSICKACAVVQLRIGTTSWAFDKPEESKDRLERFGLLTTEKDGARQLKDGNNNLEISEIFWRIVQYAFFAFAALRMVFVAFVASSSLPSRGGSAGSPIPNRPVESTILPVAVQLQARLDQDSTKQPIISYQIWSTASHLVSLPSRMPWLAGLVSLLHWFALTGAGRVGDTDGRLDRLLAHHILNPLLSPNHIPSALLTLRTTLFPGNTLPPPPPPPPLCNPAPTASSRAKTKRSAALAILNLFPRAIAAAYLATSTPSSSSYPSFSSNAKYKSASAASHTKDDEDKDKDKNDKALESMIRAVEEILDVFGDEYMNKHLVYSVLEKVVGRVVPELGEGGVGVEALLAGRGVGVE